MDTTNRASGGRIGVNEICSWFNRERVAKLDEERVAQLYFTFHPRTVFLKTLPADSEVVDIGAGDGSLSVFRSWPEPNRQDLKFYAYSIEKGRLFDDFSGYEISNWNLSQPEFDGRRFDAIVCAHFIEHIQDPVSLVKWAARKLNDGGRIYLEWPSANSLSLPSRTELEKLGVPLIISRFDDDGTHQALPDGELIAAALRGSGFAIESHGIVRLPWLEHELLGHHRESTDGFYRQAAFWSYTGWCQYIVAERVRRPEACEPAPTLHSRFAADRSPQAEIDELRHMFAVLQVEHMGSVSQGRSLGTKLSEVEGLLTQERLRTATEAEEKLRLLAERENENRRLLAESEDLRRRHEQVINSRSWKLTRPLRALANRLRGHWSGRRRYVTSRGGPNEPTRFIATDRASSMTNNNRRISVLSGQTDPSALDIDLARLHVDSAESVRSGRNVIAGYARGWGLEFGGVAKLIAEDPVYRESLDMARSRSLLLEHKLMNLFLIMKYGARDNEADFLEFGSYRGGSAIFMANVARRIGLKGTVYALDTYEGMPPTNDALDLHSVGNFADTSYEELEKYIRELDLHNIKLVKGLFSDTTPGVLREVRSIQLAHIDCDIHDAVKYCLNAVMPKMSKLGGYVVLDDPLHGSCLGAMQAVEDWIIATNVHAEQAYPHLVYRYPPLRSPLSD